MFKKMNKLLPYFYEQSERQFHIRELARITHKSPASISQHLQKLRQKKLLISQKKLNHLLYKANTEEILFKVKKRAYNIETLYNSGLIHYIQEEYNQPQAIILFGSYAKGENNPQSDIDLIIITPLKKPVNLNPFEKKLHHSLQIFTYSLEELRTLTTQNKELLNNFINGIVLEGYMELFP